MHLLNTCSVVDAILETHSYILEGAVESAKPGWCISVDDIICPSIRPRKSNVFYIVSISPNLSNVKDLEAMI